ncbi:MAG TPA: TlpA disulfide reductase family protein [Fimbriimonadaceae bacterium]|nr:TlpA disulfide reductase family protein [Fimbriimonadaceae bacterium]
MKFKSLLVLIVAAVSAFAFAGTDPDQALAAINQIRADAVNKARTSGENVNFDEVNAKMKQMALDAIKDVDPAKVEPSKAYTWAQLFAQADKYEDIHALCEKFQTTNPTPEEAFNAHFLCLQAFNELKDYDDAVSTMGSMPLPTDMAAYQVASMAAGAFAPAIAKKDGADAANKMLDSVEKRLPEKAQSDKTQIYLDYAHGMITGARADLIKNSKGVDAAIKYLTEKMDSETSAGIKNVLASNLRSMKADLKMAALINHPVPTFETGRTIGMFKGLDALKGKVVILDFFAHWCGPCKAAFPDMRKMYDDLKGQGLEIVGLTTYYGFYGQDNAQKRDMDKDVEFTKMYGFTQEHNINWPVAYIDRSVFDTFGITGIPTTYVIDRQGNVHSYHIGYSADLFKTFRAEVEKLLKE